MTMQKTVALFVSSILLAELAGGLLLIPSLAKADLTSGSTLRNGLVGHWTFDGANFVSNVVDSSSNGNTGYLINMATSSAKVAGKLGQGLLFDNTDDYVEIPHSSSLDLTSTLTITAWIKKSSLSGDDDVVAKSVFNNAFGAQYALQTSGDEIGFYYVPASFVAQYQLTTTANLETNRWYHVAVAYSDSANTIEFYVDGVLQSDTAALGTPEAESLQTFIAPVFIGETYDGEATDGVLDDVRIYNRVLTAAEVNQLARLGTNLAKPPNNLGLVGYWSFNDATSTQATDFSGNGNHGVLQNISAPPTSTSGWTTQGKRGGALRFDESNDVVGVANSPSLNFTSEMTVTAWVKFNTIPSGGVSSGNDIMGKVTDGGNWNWYMEVLDDSLQFRCNGFSCDAASTVKGFQTNTWYHVAATYVDATDTIKLYVNGVESAYLTNDASNSMVSGAHPVVFGAVFPAFNDTLDGAIDEARIYNRALGPTEVAALYGSGAIRLAANSKTLTQGSTLGSGLVAHWTFDGLDVNWTSETDGALYDASLNSNIGDINLARSYGPVIGKLGQAFLFDNTDDNVSIAPDNGTLDLNSTFTMSAWVKKNSLTGDDDLFAKDTNYFFQTSGDELSLFYFSPAAQGLATTDANLVVGQWYHVVVTYSDAANNIQFFVDGVQKGETITAGDPENSTPQLNDVSANIGTDAGSPEPFDGIIDDLRIYNRVLTASEIKQLSTLGQVKLVP